MAGDGFGKRWRSTRERRSVRESLGFKRRSESQENTEQVKESRISSLWANYDSISSASTFDRKIDKVRDLVFTSGHESFKDSDIRFALNTPSSNGDPDLAFGLLDAVEMARAGQIVPYSPDVQLLGAENYRGVTCYLDSCLAAIFGRLDDFEAMLYHNFTDPKKSRLVILLRLYVNLFRTGKLIATDLVAQICDALADLGWEQARRKEQQDASEAFNFITDRLDLPRLTLKKDMYHQGKADQDDHKFTNERTIDIGIPDPGPDGEPVKLEDCMLKYFDEQVEVDRQQYAINRRNTIGSSPAPLARRPEFEDEKSNKAAHVEVAEVNDSNPGTPIETLPMYEGRPRLLQLGRTDSIFEDKKIEAGDDRGFSPTRQNSLPSAARRKRAGTGAKAVKMPAFQFYRLIPWYTEGNPNSDLQVAQHFETKRPTVGICLKYFGQDPATGALFKKKTKIDIPLETGVPEFLHDDDFSKERFPNHKFKLDLQSVVCHRGENIQSGHYVTYFRAKLPSGPPPMDDTACPIGNNNGHDPWVLHDDLAKPRVRYVDIKTALPQETPYLLFYKIVLRGEGERPGRVSLDGRPPSYTSESGESNSNTAETVTTATDGDNTLSDVHRQKSSTSSVISATSGPPIIVQEPTISADPTVPGHGAPTIIEPRSDSIAAAEGQSILHIEQASVHARAQSSPMEETGSSVVTQTEIKTPGDAKNTRSSISNASASGSLSRSLGSIFKARSSSKNRNSNSAEQTSIDIGNVSGPTTPGAEALTAVPIMEEAPGKTTAPSTTSDPKETTNNVPKPRKSMDLGMAFGRKSGDGGRVSRRKDKGSHRRERSLGDKLKLNGNNDKPDRECSLM